MRLSGQSVPTFPSQPKNPAETDGKIWSTHWQRASLSTQTNHPYPTSQPTEQPIIKQSKDLEHLCPSSLTILINQLVPKSYAAIFTNHSDQSSDKLFQPNSTQTSYLNHSHIAQSSSSFTLSQRYHPQSFVPIILGIHHPLLNWMPCNAM